MHVIVSSQVMGQSNQPTITHQAYYTQVEVIFTTMMFGMVKRHMVVTS